MQSRKIETIDLESSEHSDKPFSMANLCTVGLEACVSNDIISIDGDSDNHSVVISTSSIQVSIWSPPAKWHRAIVRFETAGAKCVDIVPDYSGEEDDRHSQPDSQMNTGEDVHNV